MTPSNPNKLSSEELREKFSNLFQNAVAARDDVTLATEGEFIVSLMFVNDAYKYDPNKAAIDNVFDAFLDKAELLIQSYASQQVLQALAEAKSKAYEQRVRSDNSSLGSHLTVVRLSDLEDLEKQYKEANQ